MSGYGETPESATVTEKTRIFVGGLGVTVTEEDVRSTFGCLGRIETVDIIRTKGRSFAYLDFLPFSDKSLSKLFSMYNGCMWKGGRLKLEKAKEHYLLRSKQERSEDAESAGGTVIDTVDTTKSMNTLEKINKMTNPKASEIRLFFPKLRKLRPLPYIGTGKHKYSFQRIEVPALPIHFCDCEEHSQPLDSARESKLFLCQTQDGGIDKKELNIMESVMNKLFEREDKLKAGIGRLGLVNKKENAFEPVNDLAVADNKQEDIIDEDDDNLVMNTVTMGNIRKGSLRSWSQETSWDNERAIVNNLRVSKDKPLENKPVSRRLQTSLSEKKRESSDAEQSGNNIPHIDIEDKRNSKKIRLRGLSQETEKVSATSKANTSTSLLKMRENNLKRVAGDGKTRAKPVYDIAVDDISEEDDNLVLNVVGGGNIRKQPIEVGREDAIIDNKGTVPDGVQTSITTLSNSALRSQISKILASKKRKSTYAEVTADRVASTERAHPHSSTGGKRTLPFLQKSNIDGSLSKQKDKSDGKCTKKNIPTIIELSNSDDIENQNQNQNLLQDFRKEPKQVDTPPEKPKVVIIKQPKKGALWAQKSSWTDLVGGTDTTFSITQILPAMKSKEEEQPKNFFAVKPNVDGSDVKLSSGVSFSGNETKASSGVVQEKARTAPIRYSVGETCSFMKSDSSMNEWKSAKTALCKSLKKKTNEKK